MSLGLVERVYMLKSAESLSIQTFPREAETRRSQKAVFTEAQVLLSLTHLLQTQKQLRILLP